jgi:hypothetical protein
MTRAPLLVALVLAACGDTAPPGFSTGPGITSVSAVDERQLAPAATRRPPASPTTRLAAPAARARGSCATSGAAMDFGPVQPPGCKGKVDLLFVISRLGTMVTEQTQLLASFPGFIDTIEQKLEGFDVHIMTANPDGIWPGFGYCEGGVGSARLLARTAARTPRTTTARRTPTS